MKIGNTSFNPVVIAAMTVEEFKKQHKHLDIDHKAVHGEIKKASEKEKATTKKGD